MAPIIIDDQAELKALLAQIAERVGQEKDQLLFIDLEGVNLGRLGAVAIMQLLVPPSPIVYLIDVHVLGAKAFDVTADDDTSLKSILESKTIFKVFFDIRNDSDALYSHFGVNVAGVIDLQVIEYATRQPRGRFVHGLAKCIEMDLPYNRGWSLTKANGRRLFAPELGGKYEVFLERPLAADIVKYCEQDLMLMPRLLAVYGPKLHSGVAPQIQAIVDERIRYSKTVTFNGKGRHMAIGPNLAPARKYANMPTSPEVDLVRSARLGQLCRLDDSVLDNLTGQFDALQVKYKSPTVSSAGVSSSSCPASTSAESAASTNTTPVGSSVTIPTESPDGDEVDELDWSLGRENLGSRSGYANIYRDSDSDYIDRDSGSDRDYTACSASDCGYCGKCGY